MSSTCACSLQVVDAGVSTEILCEIVIVVRSNLTLFLKKTQLLALLGPSTRLKNLEQNDQLTALELQVNSSQDLYFQLWTLQYLALHRESYLYMYMKPFRSQNGELSFPTGRNSISLYLFSQNPKYRFILFQYVTLHICAKFIDPQSTIDEKQCSQIWTCFWARRRNNIPQGNCNFFRPYYSDILINHREQQIVGRKTRNLE